MSSPSSRLRSVLGHLWPSADPPTPDAGTTTSSSRSHPPSPSPFPAPNLHTLSPTAFLPRAAAIEPHAEAIVHLTANGTTLHRSYQEFADRARGLAYFLRTQARPYRRVGVLMPNTPAFLESIYGIVAAGAVIVPINYRLKEDDIAYMLADVGDVDLVLVDWEFEGLLGAFRKARPEVRIVVDTVSAIIRGVDGLLRSRFLG